MMNGNTRETIVLKDIGVLFRNFSGEARQFNSAGDRNFNAQVTEEQAEMLRKKGFRIRVVQPNKYNDETTYLLKVKVSYRFDAPNVYVLSDVGKRRLDEDTIGELDHVSIAKCDISIVGSNWVMPSGETGVTAYLRSAYVSLNVDPLDAEYAQAMNEEEAPF